MSQGRRPILPGIWPISNLLGAAVENRPLRGPSLLLATAAATFHSCISQASSISARGTF